MKDDVQAAYSGGFASKQQRTTPGYVRDEREHLVVLFWQRIPFYSQCIPIVSSSCPTCKGILYVHIVG